MNLIEYRDQNTLPEQVSVNKENIERLSDAIDKLGYTPKGEYSAETEYKYNDVVFYNSRLYAMIKENGAIVGVLPTNTEYWQVITGDIRGQQGAQGERGQQGEQGEQGEPGETPIFYRTVDADATDVIDGYYHTLSALNFLKRPTSEDVGKRVVYYHLNTSTNKVYLVEANITSASIESTVVNTITLRVVQITGEKGNDGADGLPALVYDGTIPFVRNGEETQLVMTPTITSIGSFNHIPALNEDFVALLKDTDTNIVYIANCEVQTKVGNNVTSVVISNIARLTGADGQNGTDGLDALIYKKAYEVLTSPGTTTPPVVLNKQYFNRKPVVGDAFQIIWKNTSTGQSYAVLLEVTSLSGEFVNNNILSYVETTGAQGQSGEIGHLYEHNLAFVLNNSSLFMYVRVTIISTYGNTFMTDDNHLNTIGASNLLGGFKIANGFVSSDKICIGILYNKQADEIQLNCIPKELTGYTPPSTVNVLRAGVTLYDTFRKII